MERGSIDITSLSKEIVKIDKSRNDSNTSMKDNGSKLTVKDDEVVLLTAANPWRPSRTSQQNLSDEEAANQKLLKTFRSYLNKLAPKNFDVLIKRASQLDINTYERWLAVAAVLYEKAIRESLYACLYASFIKEMSILDANSKYRALVTRMCQFEFQRTPTCFSDAQKRVNMCRDSHFKSLFEKQLKDVSGLSRRRIIGNAIFVTQLFKCSCIDKRIIFTSLNTLLMLKGNLELECACKMLRVGGKILDSICSKETTKLFEQIQSIADNGELKLSKRIRFMLQDILELRDNEWIFRVR